MIVEPDFRLLNNSERNFDALLQKLKSRLSKTDLRLCLLNGRSLNTPCPSRRNAFAALCEKHGDTTAEFPDGALLCGASRDIYELSLLSNERINAAALIVLDTPLTPHAADYLSEAFGAELFEVLLDDNALPLALACGGDGRFEPLSNDADWFLIDRFDVRRPNDGWGRLACIKDGELHKFDINAQLFRNDAGRIVLKCAGLEDPGLLFPEDRPVDIAELHRAFSAFEIFDYRIAKNGCEYEISVSCTHKIEKSYIQRRVQREFPAMFPGAIINVTDAEKLPDAPRISVSDEARPREVFIWRSENNLVPAFVSENITPDNIRNAIEADAHIASRDAEALEAVSALLEGKQASGDTAGIMIYGVQTEIAHFNICSACASDFSDSPILAMHSHCGKTENICRVCPVDAIAWKNDRFEIDGRRCIRCFVCVERFPEIFRSVLNSDALSNFNDLSLYLCNKKTSSVRKNDALPDFVGAVRQSYVSTLNRRGPVVLGLACVTMTENSAALLVDGELVAAIEEERINRIKHYGWKDPERPESSLASDALLQLHQAMPQGAINSLLRQAGLSLADVDAVAFNGLPFRFRHSYSKNEAEAAPQILREGNLFFVPHHLAHAASAYCMSGFEEAAILSIDGRGDRETLAIFEAEGDSIRLLRDIPYEPDRSIGGVYETYTRILGFGNFGQGSTMALAAFGNPQYDLSASLNFGDPNNVHISEWKSACDFADFERDYADVIEVRHKNLASALQITLENNVLKLLKTLAPQKIQNLCVCGGVGLNCRMNGRILDESGAKNLFVPPGANDAGTAIGAAFLAHRELCGRLPRKKLSNAFLGPSFESDEISEWLESKGIVRRRMEDVALETAELLADGKIVCWFSGRMEFGPRALGARSILADPRRMELKKRLNAMKSRQDWRPFGVSVMHEFQGDWFENSVSSPFMLLALKVKSEKRKQIPVALHADGSSRPQSIAREDHPLYYSVIEEFRRLTGIPMLVNTSFNRGGEPIVCTPAQAFLSFARMGADALVLEDLLILKENLR